MLCVMSGQVWSCAGDTVDADKDEFVEQLGSDNGAVPGHPHEAGGWLRSHMHICTWVGAGGMVCVKSGRRWSCAGDAVDPDKETYRKLLGSSGTAMCHTHSCDSSGGGN